VTFVRLVGRWGVAGEGLASGKGKTFSLVSSPNKERMVVDITVVGTALSSIKSALEIVKAIREAGETFQAAEWKLKLADLMETLADARIEVVNVQDVVLDREKRIKELEDALAKTGELVRHLDAYYIQSDEGKPTGHPKCLRCWDVDHRLINLYRSGTAATSSGASNAKNQCPSCNTAYTVARSDTFLVTINETMGG